MFKFQLKDEVYHTGYRRNCIIRSQIHTNDFSGNYISYDLYVLGSEGFNNLNDSPEFWLEQGHRIE